MRSAVTWSAQTFVQGILRVVHRTNVLRQNVTLELLDAGSCDVIVELVKG